MKSREGLGYWSVYDADTVTRTNAMKLRLLKLVPEFQKKVTDLRDNIGILPETNGEEDAHDYVGEAIASLTKHKIPTFQDHPLHQPSEESLSHPFNQGVIAIGEKFRLPYNLYNDWMYGIAFYVLTNRIRVPNVNWELDSDKPKGSRKPRWVGIRIYAPLNADEIKGASRSLKQVYPGLIGYYAAADRHARIELEDNLPIVEGLLKRHGTPKRVKQYLGYLAIIAKQGFRSAAEKRKLEKIHAKCIKLGFDMPTSREIARRMAKTGEVARNALVRLNKTAIKMFGYGFKNTDTSSDT